MSDYTPKNIFLTVIQLPFFWVLLLVNKQKLYLMRILSKLDNPISSPIKDMADKELLGLSEINPGKIEDGLLFLKKEMTCISWKSDSWIEGFRCIMEKTSKGLSVIRTSSDRRLYAVLKPTRAENLQRIKNVFRAHEGYATGLIERMIHNAMELYDAKQVPPHN